MQIQNIAGYKFVSLQQLPLLREMLVAECRALFLKGTILLSAEGINVALSGEPKAIQALKDFFKKDDRFSDMTFRESFSDSQVFKRMKVKIKKEIITFKQEDIFPMENRAPHLSPTDFKKWLDENRDMIILDTRNNYEMAYGTFKNAVNLHLEDFSEFPEKSKDLPKEKPIVMFCTGGVRCEKAALHLLQKGFNEVYQLDGGILNYFAEVGGEHYEGSCFVFDDRIAVTHELKTIQKD